MESSRRRFVGSAIAVTGGVLGALTARGPADAATGTVAEGPGPMTVDVTSLWVEADGTVPHPTGPGRLPRLGPALERALSAIVSDATTVVLGFPSGTHVLPSFTLDRPVRIASLGPSTARFGTDLPDGGRVYGGAALWWDGAGDDPFVTVRSNGVELEGIALYGGDRAGTALQVEFGYELGLRRVRLSSWQGTALRIDHTGNATLDQVFVEHSGTTNAPAVDVNSRPPSFMDPIVRTNTVDFRGLTIEQSRGTALRIGVDPDRNQKEHGQLPSFLRFSDLHIESVPTDDSAEFAPNAPAVLIGAAVSVSFLAPFLYAGPDALVRHEEPADRPSSSEGVTIVGGTLLGRDATTLVDLVRGDGFSISAVRLRGIAPSGNAFVLGPGYRGAVRIDAATFFYVGADGGVQDSRTVPRAPFRIHGDTVLGGGLWSTANPALLGRPGPANVGVELRGADDLRGTVRIAIPASVEPGDLATVVLGRPGAPEGAVVVSAADAVSAAAGVYGRLDADRYGRMTIVVGAASPRPATTITVHYVVIG